MAKGPKKSERKWLYLDEEGQARLAKLAASFPQLSEPMILGTIAAAALRACEKSDFKVLPGHFSVDEPAVIRERPDTHGKNRLNDGKKNKAQYPKGSE